VKESGDVISLDKIRFQEARERRNPALHYFRRQAEKIKYS